jgi:hypothetical protein
MMMMNATMHMMGMYVHIHALVEMNRPRRVISHQEENIVVGRSGRCVSSSARAEWW